MEVGRTTTMRLSSNSRTSSCSCCCSGAASIMDWSFSWSTEPGIVNFEGGDGIETGGRLSEAEEYITRGIVRYQVVGRNGRLFWVALV